MVLKIYFMFFGIINFFRSKRNKNVCILQLNYIFKEETSLSLSLSCLNLLNIQAWSFWLFLFVLLETSPVFRSVCAWKILGSGRRRHDIALISAKKSNRIELLAIKIFLCKLMETLKGLLTSEWETKLELELEQRACNLQISTSPGDWLALIAPIAHFNWKARHKNRKPANWRSKQKVTHRNLLFQGSKAIPVRSPSIRSEQPHVEWRGKQQKGRRPWSQAGGLRTASLFPNPGVRSLRF